MPEDPSNGQAEDKGVMNMKWVQRGIGVCLIVVLASGLSILTTGVVVNAYIQSVLTSFNIKLEQPAPGIVGMMRTLIGTEKKPVQTSAMTDSGSRAEEKSGQNKTQSGVKNTSKPSPPPSPGSRNEKPAEEKVPEDALPVMGQAAGESAQSQQGQDQRLVMTPEALRDMKDNLPNTEKASIFNILMNKLPAEEMQKISSMMEDGLTDAEVKEIQSMIAKYVDPKEYEELMSMLTPSGTNQTGE